MIVFQRWLPSRGWSGQNLLPGVDPWMWSSDDCLRCLPKEDFKLPSEHWEWESGWYVDENVHGHLTDKGVCSIVLLCAVVRVGNFKALGMYTLVQT